MKQANKGVGVPEHMHHRIREVLLIVAFAISIYLLLALGSYHHSDPSWSMASNNAQIANAGGRAGAYISDVFLYWFGYPAYFFPLLGIWGAWTLFRMRSETYEFHWIAWISRGLGFALIILASSGLASLLMPNAHAHLPFKAGGIIGLVTGNGLADYLNPLGAGLLLMALLLSGITLFAGVSWLAFVDKVGEYTLILWQKLVDLAKQLPSILKKHKSKLATRTAIIETPAVPVAIVSKPQAAAPEAKKKWSKKTEQKPAKAVTFRANKAVEDSSLPSLSLLEEEKVPVNQGASDDILQDTARLVEAKLAEFNIQAKVVAVMSGPVVTRYELELAPGIKVSKLTTLAKDLARSLSVVSVRIVEVIPGKPYVGLELPNDHREIVQLQGVFASDAYAQSRSPLSMGLGKDIAGHSVVVDLAKMPHLLVAGTTGSGKSVGLNAMLLSLLYKSTPQDVRLILIDPKMLELAIYDGIPHLLTPVVTDMKEAANALSWCVEEMERRYRLMASLGVRNLTGYNAKIQQAQERNDPLYDPLWQPQSPEDEQPLLEALPYIVVLIDEFADMMMVVGKKVEELIARIAQKARAAGIHLILATQRPSVDVITGLIKANVPSRIAFQVSSRIDSRTILDQQGAEHLLGHGDMLYLPPGSSMPVRVHGAFVSDQEVHNVVNDLKQKGEPIYLDEILDGPTEGGNDGFGTGTSSNEDLDPLYDEAVAIVTESRRASISGVQRRLKIGYNRAARLVEEMENQGVVTPMESNGNREVLAPPPPKD